MLPGELVNVTTFTTLTKNHRHVLVSNSGEVRERCTIAVHLQVPSSLRIQPSVESMLTS